MNRIRALTGVAIVVALPLAVIRVFHGMADMPWFQIDLSDLAGWTASTPLPDALSAVARLLALAVAYWSLIGTILYLIAVLTGSAGFSRLVAPFTLPVVRRLADRVVAGSVSLSVLAVPLLTASGPPPTSPSPDPASSHAVAPGYMPTPRWSISLPPDRPRKSEPVAFSGRPTTAAPMPEAPEPNPVTGPTEITVRAGDHLWGLADERLAEQLGRSVADHDLAPYWRAVVEANTSRLRSGDPDVIMAGEVVILPDPTPFMLRGS